MDRVIKLSELRDAVNAAYEEFKSIKEGTVDSRLEGVKEDLFGISIALADGTVINKGDSDAIFPLGQLSRVPVLSLRVEQKAKQQAVKDAKCDDKECHCKASKEKKADIEIPFSPRGIKSMSKLEPTGDPDSKWNFIENRMISLAGSAPRLDVKLYETLKAQAKEANVVETINNTPDYKLADDAAQSVDLYLRANSMTVNTQQLAEMGATILADGVNPFTRQIVYDGKLSQRIVAHMAMKSHKLRRFIMKTGIATASGFGGGVLAILPGVFSIAAYSPRLCERGNSIKAMRAIAYIMNKLELSMFGSAKVVIEK